MWHKLSKLKEGILEITLPELAFEDTFSSVKLREYYLAKYKLSPPCKIEKTLQPKKYKALVSLIASINLFKPRDEVPNKIVTTDVQGTSKLVRSKDKTRLEIAYRVKNKAGVQENRARSNNTCYISIATRELFFKDSKETGCPVYHKSHNHYFLTIRDHAFDYWSKFMDKEYIRLAGDKYTPKPKQIKPHWSEAETKQANLCVSAYAESSPGTDLEIIKDLSQAGLARLDNKQLNLYNKNGYWICELEEFLERDGQAYMLRWILTWLDLTELNKACKIIEKYIKEY